VATRLHDKPKNLLVSNPTLNTNQIMNSMNPSSNRNRSRKSVETADVIVNAKSQIELNQGVSR
jgi:hypothetical protein